MSKSTSQRVELPRLWFSAGGNERLWGDHGTYGAVAYDKLPPLSVDGSFRWLAPPRGEMSLMGLGNDEQDVPPADKLSARVREATAVGLKVPEELLRFLSDENLYHRVPSCTACYFDVGDRLVEVPGHDGPARLLRFMNDQQVCLLWYVLLEPDAQHRVVVAGPGWLDDNSAKTLDDAMVPEDPAICADSFEEFIKRFWIENTLWWSVNEGFPPIDGELKAYVDAVAARKK